MRRRRAQRPVLSDPPAQGDNRRTWGLAALLVVATLLVYAQVWDFPFLSVDDSAYVPGNAQVLEGLTWKGFVWSFTTVHDSNWIPFTWLSLMLDTELHSRRPGGYHVTNVLLHAANTALLFVALMIATRNRGRSAMVAALFALHPLHVESVAWVAERKDVLSIFFGLMSLVAYVRYAKGAGRWNYVAAVIAFVCSLLSKQTLVTFPFVLLLLDFWPLGRLGRIENSSQPPAARANPSAARLIVEKLPFLAAGAIFSAIAMIAQTRGGAVQSYPLPVRFMNALYVYVAYLWKTVYPQNLAVYYPHPGNSISWSVAGPVAVVLVAISVAAIIWIRRYPFLFVGWFWYLGTLVPVIGVVQIGSQGMADRYTYFPLIGVFLAVVWLVPELLPAGAHRTRLLMATGLASVVLFAAITFCQISYWHDGVTLLRHSMDSTPDNSVAHEFLSSALFAEGADKEAIAETEAAIRLAPRYAPLHYDLAAVLQKRGRLDEALEHYRAALAIDDRYPAAHIGMAATLLAQGKSEEARLHFMRALELDESLSIAHANLSLLCLRTGDFAGCIAHGERALQLDPGWSRCRYYMGLALRGQGHVDEAISQFRQFLEVAPRDPDAKRELDRTLAMKHSPPAH